MLLVNEEILNSFKMLPGQDKAKELSRPLPIDSPSIKKPAIALSLVTDNADQILSVLRWSWYMKTANK